MRQRLNKKKIYPNRSREVSKTEAENLMGQRFPPDTVKALQKKLEDWKKEHSWTCTCGRVNEDLQFNCTCCDLRKIFKH